MVEPVAVYLVHLCICLTAWHILPSLAAGPYQSKCDWSEWRCLDRPDGVGCVAQRSRLCCNGTSSGCQVDSYVHKTLYSLNDQLAEGIICLRRKVIGPAASSGSSEHQEASSVLAAAAAPTCLSRPRFDGAKFPPPSWCPWTEWSSWTVDCRTGLTRLPVSLAGLIRLGNDSEAFKYASRSRGCYCPASPDPTYTCPGRRLDWQYKSLRSAASPSDPSRRSLSAVTPEPAVCQWCSWESWLPACTCPLPKNFPAPSRRRSCICFAGDALIEPADSVGTGNANYSACGQGSELQVATSAKLVCPVCSHLHADYQVSQFLNPLAIGFAVYLLVALAAFLLCRLFCGNPRHSDANSRDQLSVDDFLASPPGEAATSAV